MFRRIREALFSELIHAIAGHPHHEQVADALIEEQFRRHPRIGARQDRGERRLPLLRDAFPAREIPSRMPRLSRRPSRRCRPPRLSPPRAGEGGRASLHCTASAAIPTPPPDATSNATIRARRNSAITSSHKPSSHWIPRLARVRLHAISPSGMMVRLKCGFNLKDENACARSHRPNSRAIILTISLPVVFAFGCANDAIEANRRQVEANQALIEQTQQQLAMLQAQQNSGPPPPASGTARRMRQEGRGHRDQARRRFIRRG